MTLIVILLKPWQGDFQKNHLTYKPHGQQLQKQLYVSLILTHTLHIWQYCKVIWKAFSYIIATHVGTLVFLESTSNHMYELCTRVLYSEILLTIASQFSINWHLCIDVFVFNEIFYTFHYSCHSPPLILVLWRGFYILLCNTVMFYCIHAYISMY